MVPVKPDISVVMSTFNDSAYLPETIDSVLAQTFTDFEYIIINDGSPDPQTELILEGYAAKDIRIKVIHKENEGLTRALINGCDAAQGEYIARVDVGDRMLPQRLQLQKEILDSRPDVGLVSCWTEYCAPEWETLYCIKGKNTTRRETRYPIPDKIVYNLVSGPTCHPSVMFRNALYKSVGGYRRQFYYGQDWDLWYRMAEKSLFYLISQTLYKVRIFPQGISMTRKGFQDEIAECSKEALIARLNGEDETPFLAKASQIRPVKTIGKKKTNLEPGYYFIAENLRHQNKLRSRIYFLKALRENIFSVRSWIRLCQTFM